MFEQGQIVYWIGTNTFNGNWPHYYVRWGIVETEYPYVIYITLYEKVNTKKLNGIPLKDYECNYYYQKLPKGWTYNTKLFELTDDGLPEEFYNLKINSEEDIKYAINKGYLIPVNRNPHWTPYAEIDKNKGWRIVKQYDNKVHDYTTVDKCQVYTTFEEAQAEVDRLTAEFERQSNLSEEEWSKEEIENCIKIWAKQNGLEPDSLRVQKVRDILMNLDHVEDVEVRTSSGIIQYKYWKKTRWIDVE